MGVSISLLEVLQFPQVRCSGRTERPGKGRGNLSEGMGLGHQADCGLFFFHCLYLNSLYVSLGFIPIGRCSCLSHWPKAGSADP